MRPGEQKPHSAVWRLLATDEVDPGCGETFELIDVFVELELGDGPAAARSRFPGIAVHLLQCWPCAEDYRGLLAVA